MHTKITCVHPSGTERCKSRRLYSLSANFTSFARADEPLACTICNRFRSSLASVLSSVTSCTIVLTSSPNSWPISSNVVSVSSTVSCSMAAKITETSDTPPSCVKIWATPLQNGKRIVFLILKYK